MERPPAAAGQEKALSFAKQPQQQRENSSEMLFNVPLQWRWLFTSEKFLG